MANASPPRTQAPPQPPVMALIRERRKRAHLSFDRAGQAAGISGTRWRQLEDGRRAIRGVGYIPEYAPAATLARMAHAVGVTPAELEPFGVDEAVTELVLLAESRALEDGAARAEARRLAGMAEGLTGRQRDALEERIAADLRAVRDGE